MPEADAVERTARRLDRLAGHVLTRCELRWPSVATVDLSGRLVLETARVGKHLLTRFAADGSRPGVSLHSHLRMEGSWRVGPVGEPPPRRHTVRAVLETQELRAVGDRLGLLHLVRTDREHTLVGHLGPDILTAGSDVAAVVDRVRRAPGPVGAALLDQRVVAGLGTMWVSEGLHAGRVNPWTPGADVEPDALAGTLRRLAERITDSLDGREGPRRVYGLRRRPCRWCDTAIRRDPIGVAPRQRELFWCPGCQPD